MNFKKAIASAVLVAGAAMLFCCAACGEAKTPEPEPVKELEFSYALKEDGTYDICGMSYGDYKQMADLVIPSQYNGAEVTSISSLDSNIVSCKLTLPKTIKKINSNVFEHFVYDTKSDISVASDTDDNYVFRLYYQGSIEEWMDIDFEGTGYAAYSNPMYSIRVTLQGNNGMSYTGSTHNEFYYTDADGESVKLTSLNISGRKMVSPYQFAGFNTLEQVSFDGVSVIGNYAFSQCFGLQQADCTGVTVIEGYAFSYCYALQNIELSESLTEIGERAFYLTTPDILTIPASVKFIGWDIIYDNENYEGEVILSAPKYWVLIYVSSSSDYHDIDYSEYENKSVEALLDFTKDNFLRMNGHNGYSSYVFAKVR